MATAPNITTFATVPYGEIAILRDDSREMWCKIEWNGLVGWASKANLRKIDPDLARQEIGKRLHALEFLESHGHSSRESRELWAMSNARELSWPLCLAHVNLSATLDYGIATQVLIESVGEFEAYCDIAEQIYRDMPGYIFVGKKWLKRLNEIREKREHERSDRI